jgi:hypothetical protein
MYVVILKTLYCDFIALKYYRYAEDEDKPHEGFDAALAEKSILRPEYCYLPFQITIHSS